METTDNTEWLAYDDMEFVEEFGMEELLPEHTAYTEPKRSFAKL